MILILPRSADIYQKKNLKTLSEGKMVWIQIRTDKMSVLICVQTVCKGNQQMTKFATIKKKSYRFFGLTLICDLTISDRCPLCSSQSSPPDSSKLVTSPSIICNYQFNVIRSSNTKKSSVVLVPGLKPACAPIRI